MSDEPRLILADYLDDAVLIYYRPRRNELVANGKIWPTLSPKVQERLKAHEMGHHATGTVCLHPDDPNQEQNVRKLEAKADRKALETLIPDEAISNALGEGYETVVELAEACGVDVVTMEARLALFQRRRAS